MAGPMPGVGEGFEGTPPDAEAPSMDLETAIQVLEHFGITPDDVAVVVVALETVLNAGGGPQSSPAPAQPVAPKPAAPAAAATAPANASRPVPAPRPPMAPPAEEPMTMPAPRQAAPRAPTGNPLVDIADAPPQPNLPLPLNQRRKNQPAY